jgi:hypothetical protein
MQSCLQRTIIDIGIAAALAQTLQLSRSLHCQELDLSGCDITVTCGAALRWRRCRTAAHSHSPR